MDEWLKNVMEQQADHSDAEFAESIEAWRQLVDHKKPVGS